MRKKKSKNKIIYILVIVVAVVFVTMFSGCTTKLNSYNSLAYFGTSINVYAYTTQSMFSKLEGQIDEILDDLKKQVDSNVVDSDVDKINKANPGESIEVNNYTYEIFNIAKDVFNKTDGAFDPTVYLLTDLWGFTGRFFKANYSKTKDYDRDFSEEGSYLLPDTKYIEAFKELVDFSLFSAKEEDGKYIITKGTKEVTVDGKKYTQQIDLGGIVKGYASDLIYSLFEKNRIGRGYISFGNSSLSVLTNEMGREWNILLTNPRYNKNTEMSSTYCSFNLKNNNISTSGDYERYYEIDGKRYCHIIDPKTGYPIDNSTITITMLGDSGAYLDAYTTAYMVLGYEEVIKTDLTYAVCYEIDGTIYAQSNISGFKITEKSIIEGTIK
ncbi:MAG: FAD:protein FMN transferase [Clostridia bacterium]|nr:FAD:protein FMN transferase [Clostridia bacterium]